MKKLIFIAPLLAISFLTNCGGGSSPTKDVKFSVQESAATLKEDNTIDIHLDWDPSSDIIEFSHFTFALDNQTSVNTTVTPGTAGSRPLELTIAFDKYLKNADTGDLTFDYKDVTTKKEGKGKVEDIKIHILVDAIDMTVDVAENEVISFECEEKDKVRVDWGDGNVNNKNSHTYVEAKEYTITIYGDLNSFKYTSKSNDSLLSVTIGNVVSFANAAFMECSGLNTVDCQENTRLKEISKQCFFKCSKLSSVTIPDSVISIGGYAFQNCDALKTIKLNKSSQLQTIGTAAFVNCDLLASFAVPDTVTLIDTNAFASSGLNAITINKTSSLKKIDDFAFNGSDLPSIFIPNTVTTIGREVFSRCSNLSVVDLTDLDHVPTLGDKSFDKCSTKIYVSSGMLSSFQSAEGWSTYASRITDDPIPK